MLRPLLLVALAWPVPDPAQPVPAASSPGLQNWFGDPFFQIANGVPDCPEPAGPRTTEAERQKQTHHRAERGTTCWLAGQCDRPNSYAYDADIATAIRQGLSTRNPFARASVWVTVQGRVVYLEGCVPEPAMEMALEAFAREIPDVQQAIAAVQVRGQAARAPYRLLSDPP